MSFEIFNLKPFNQEINTLAKVKAEFDFKLDDEIDELVENPNFKSNVLKMYKSVDENILKDLHNYLRNKDARFKGSFCYYYITEMGMSQSKICTFIGLSAHQYRELQEKYEAEWKKFAIELKNCEIQEHTAYLAYTTIWNFINIDNSLVDLDLLVREEQTILKT